MGLDHPCLPCRRPLLKLHPERRLFLSMPLVLLQSGFDVGGTCYFSPTVHRLALLIGKGRTRIPRSFTLTSAPTPSCSAKCVSTWIK